MTPPIAVPVNRKAVTFAHGLSRFGEQIAVTTANQTITYAQLADRVDDAAAQLGNRRRLVVQVARNTVESLVWYLGALQSGNPLILLPDGNGDALTSLTRDYDADVVIDSEGTLTSHRERSTHDLHPELALLLSTSGSTGSPKLVRLSHRNLAANAESIADYLQIRATDRAATTLPMGYSYGLSVINSHLANGAGLVLTELSVVDECFWTLFTRAEATTFAGVPYTFDLLERAGFADLDLPRLRYITAAGGRLAPHRVRTLAELGQRTGWDLFVMYGQTEATARMAYLPPDLAAAQPASIGIAIPGGALDLAPVDGEPSGDVGELVYTGANVMLGYAQEPADLALGRTTSVLRTGDLARVTDTGMYEIVGRRGGFAKLFGKRIDLQEVERSLGAHGINATCLALIPQSDSSADSERLVVAVVRADDCWPGSDRIRAAAAEAAAVAPTAIQVLDLPELPRLSSGKVDLPALRKLATQPNPRGAAEGDTSDVAEGDLVTSLVSAYAATLNRDDASVASSFVSLRGDSMSYVELSVVVERLLGKLPANWHVMSIGALANTVTTQSGGSQPPPHRNRWTRQIETNVLLRALAVFLVVGSHVTLFDLRGGAHLLIAIAGFNFARFHLSNSERRTRLRGMLASVRRIAVPSMVWMAFAALLDSQYSFANVFFLHNVVMPDADNAAWRYWFVEALVYLLIFSAAVVAIPALHRAEQRWPFGFVLVLLGVGLVFRYGLIETATGPKAIYTPAMVLFVFALGWAIARARTWPQRGLVVALIVVTLPGYSENLTRVVIVMAGLALLLLVPTVRVPSLLGKGVGLVAGASLYIYLSHWQVYPLFGEQELLALAASVGFGIALWFTVGRLTARTKLSRVARFCAVVEDGAVPTDSPHTAFRRQLREQTLELAAEHSFLVCGRPHASGLFLIAA